MLTHIWRVVTAVRFVDHQLETEDNVQVYFLQRQEFWSKSLDINNHLSSNLTQMLRARQKYT